MSYLTYFINATAEDLKENHDKFRFSHDLKMAKIFPGGRDRYFDDVIFNIYKNLENNLFGNAWIDNGSKNPFEVLEKSGKAWLFTFAEVWVEHYSESTEEQKELILSDVRTFLQEYFYIQNIKKYLLGLNGSQIIKTFRLKEGITRGHITAYYTWLKDNGDIDCSEAEFKTIFSNDELPEGWKPIKYLKMYGRNPHRTALSAIIRELTDIKKKAADEKLMSYFFVDKNNGSIFPGLNQSDNTLNKYLPIKVDSTSDSRIKDRFNFKLLGPHLYDLASKKTYLISV